MPGLIDNWIITPNGQQITASLLFHKVTGKPPEAALKYGYLAAVLESDRDRFLRFITHHEIAPGPIESTIVVATFDRRAALLTTITDPVFEAGRLTMIQGMSFLRYLPGVDEEDGGG